MTWQASEGTPVAVGTVNVEELVTMADGLLVVRTEEAVGAAVGFPPFRHVQALESFSGTFDQRAAYAGKVWVGAFVYAEQKGFATTANSSKTSRQESLVQDAVARS